MEPTPEFAILGTLEVHVGDREVELRGQKQRALLAILLVHANEVVSVDRLIEELWDGESPATAQNTLQVYVAQLRKALAAAGSAEATLVTRAPGYMLQVPPDRVDAGRFARLANEGRESLRNGDPETALALLDEALELRRGPALSEFPYNDFAQAERGRLEEVWLGALEDRFQAALELGRGAELIGELRGYVAEHPLRERLRTQLGLALYRAGRQADALAELRQARTDLVEELGLEPGPELRALERAILQQDEALRSATTEQARLRPPLPPVPLLGRESEVQAVLELARRPEVRLVTLTGPGGIGKTRLALAAAEALADDYEDGAVFVDLAPISRAQLVAPTIAKAVGATGPTGTPSAEGLEETLADRSILLVVDNFEQVLAAGLLLAVLLARAPGLKVLATSRAALRLTGEHEFPVPPLPLAPEGVDTETLLDSPAVQLFVRRAQAVRHDFRPSPEDAVSIGRICVRLDGIPLAIELAAAWAKVLEPQVIIERLERPLELLSRGPRDLPARQQTLRTTLDWSFDLLDPAEQRLFARLSVFIGGWTLEAAEHVVDETQTRLLELLGSLIDKSLVRQLAGSERFDMLETIRGYAFERVEDAGEREAVARRHLDWFVGLTERAETELEGRDQRHWLDVLEGEHDNLRAAFAFALEIGDRESALRLGGSLRRFWQIHGHLAEGRRALEAALERTEPVADDVLAKALNGVGVLAGEAGDFVGARGYFVRALELAREVGDPNRIASALSNLGTLALFETAYGEAHERYEEAVRLWTKAGNEQLVAAGLENLGCVAFCQGDLDEALELLVQSEALARQTGHQHNLSSTLLALARTLLVRGELEEAGERLDESAAIALELGERHGIADALEGYAGLAAAEGDPARAARLFGAAEAAREAIGARRRPDNQAWYESFVALATAPLGQAAFAGEFERGKESSADEAFTEARLYKTS